jgi:hypothetical protein
MLPHEVPELWNWFVITVTSLAAWYLLVRAANSRITKSCPDLSGYCGLAIFGIVPGEAAAAALALVAKMPVLFVLLRPRSIERERAEGRWEIRL